MGIDVRTLILVLGIAHLIQVAVFFQQYRINKTYPGVGWWLLWSAAEVVGFGLLLLWDIPFIRLMAITVQNPILFLGTIFIYIGVMRFLEKKENRSGIIFFFAVFIAAHVHFIYVHDDIAVRGLIFSLSQVAISFFAARALLVHRTLSIAASANFNAAIFLVHGGVFTHRAVMILAGTPVAGVFTPTLFNYLPYLDALIVSLLWTFGFIIMLNQRLNAETAEAKEHFELIFNTSPDAALITRLTDGLIVNINDGFTALTGFTRNETIGKSTLAVNIWHNSEDLQRFVNALGEKGFCENREAVFLRKDGSQAVGILSAKIISLRNIPHAISLIRDITERKQAEEDIHRLNDELERRVLERTAQRSGP